MSDHTFKNELYLIIFKIKNMKNLSFLIPTLTIIFLSSCAKIYYSPDARTRANSHKIVAIAPPRVSIAAKKKVDTEAIKEKEKTESFNFQNEMYSWLLKRKMQNRITIELQDIETTNAKLRKAGYFDDNPLSPTEICELLNVDGLFTSNFSLSQPMSEGGAVALGLFTGAMDTTNQTTATLEIHDRETNKMIWNYNHKVSGSVGSTPTKLVDNLMKSASKKSPYTK